MSVDEVGHVVNAWVEVYDRLGSQPGIEYVMIFENRGAVMGNSQLHPHGQAYAYGSIPDLMVREQLKMFQSGNFVSDVLAAEQEDGRRMVHEDDSFSAFVPFAAWLPYDVVLLPRRPIRSLSEATAPERADLSGAMKRILSGLDQLFGSPYQYSLALIQAPTDGSDVTFHTQIHISSLLRGPDVRKHIVGADIFGRSVNPSDPNVSAAEIRHAIARARLNS
jgi:UDPglucose--hexose-1-phosphate uridylyltransferase